MLSHPGERTTFLRHDDLPQSALELSARNHPFACLQESQAVAGRTSVIKGLQTSCLNGRRQEPGHGHQRASFVLPHHLPSPGSRTAPSPLTRRTVASNSLALREAGAPVEAALLRAPFYFAEWASETCDGRESGCLRNGKGLTLGLSRLGRKDP